MRECSRRSRGLAGALEAARDATVHVAPRATAKRRTEEPSMLQGVLSSLQPSLRKLPLADRTARVLRYYQLCRGPYEGEADRIRQRFEALHCMVGSDRLPLGSNPPQLAECLDILIRHGVAANVPPLRRV